MIRALLPDQEKQNIADSTLDVLTQLVIDELSSEILDESPWFISQLMPLISAYFTSPGYIDLTPSAGPLTKRFYRVQKVTTSSGQEYGAGSARDVVTYSSTDVSSQRFTYVVMGSQLWLFPLSATTDIELRYSFLPAAFTTLLDTATVPWPDGFDSVYVHEVVARLTADMNWSNRHHAIHAAAFGRLKSRTKREYIGPAVMAVSDSPSEWGGE